MRIPKPNARNIFIVLAAMFSLRLFAAWYLELAPDEAYYWYWSQNLDFSYYDHPPMVAWIMAVFTAIGGQREIFVRLGGFFCAILALLFIFRMTGKLFPEKRNLPWEVMLVLNLTLIFPAGSIIQTPDTPMLLFWAAAIYFGAQIVTGADTKYWYAWGAALGLGLLSKYTMILLVPMFACFLVLSPKQRFWFTRKEPYIAGLVAFILFSPVLFWNSQHHWVSFMYQLNQGFSPKHKMIILKLLEYLGGQAGVVTPLLFIAFLYYSIKGISRAMRVQGNENSRVMYLAWMSWPVLIFFALTTIKGKVAEANWPAPAYAAGFVLAWAVFRLEFSERKRHRNFMGAALVLAAVASITVQLHLLYPVIPIPPENDQMRQFHSWRSLGTQVRKYIDSNRGPEKYFLVSDKGTTVAEAVFYAQGGLIGLDFSNPQRYIFLDVEKLENRDALIISHNFSPATPKPYCKYFEDVKFIAAHPAFYRGKEMNDLSVGIMLGQGFKTGWRPE